MQTTPKCEHDTIDVQNQLFVSQIIYITDYNGIVAITYKTLKPANHEHYASYL